MVLCFLMLSLFVHCGESQLDDALRDGNMMRAKAILALRPHYLQSRNDDGRTRLHNAVLKNRPEIVELLLSKNGDVNAADRYGFTPLHYAAQRGREDMVRCLLDSGAALEATTHCGYTALHWAAERGHESTVRMLIDHGADVYAEDTDGRKPAQSAEEMGHWRVARRLYPLHWASQVGDVSSLTSLIDLHPNLLFARDGLGRTALHVAERYDQQEAVQVLIEKGADPKVEDACGLIPSDYGAGSRSARTGVEALETSVLEGIDHEVYAMLNRYHYVNVGVVVDGEIVLTKTYGERSLLYSCAWGSVSKPVTAMLVMHLVSQRIIESIDDPIWTYSPRYRNGMPDLYQESVLTIRHLLTHTSGVPHNDEPTWVNGKLNLKFAPGTRNHYSTPGYGILGHVIEDVTGMSYSQAVKTYIGSPAGAKSFRAGEDFRAPGARVYSNIHDMALFSIGVMHHVYVPEELFFDEMIQYHNGPTGIGWGIQNLNDDYLTILHGGSNGKPQAHLMIKPRKMMSISILASAKDPSTFHLDALSFRLLEVLENGDGSTMDEAAACEDR